MVFKQDFIGPVSGAILTNISDVTEATFTITGVGFTGTVNGTARYLKFGSGVLLFIPTLSGVSNVTTFTLSGIPAAIQAARVQKGFAMQVTDNTVLLASPGILNINAGATAWDVFKDFSEAIWTAAGTKALSNCVICYSLL